MANIYGLDLGTGNIKIYAKQGDRLLNERNLIAISGKTQLFSFGDDAYEMYEKAPANIEVSYPMVNGVISDLRNMQTLLKCFLDKISKSNIKGSSFLVAVPKEITEVEKRSFFDVLKTSYIKPKQILMVEKPVADAAGLGLDVINSKGIMIVNIGADTTEISVISLGGIVLSSLMKIGGKKLDESIRTAIRKNHALNIGEKTAELLKKELGYAMDPEDISAPVYGVNLGKGLPVEVNISAETVSEAIQGNLHSICDEIKNAIESTPPELASDIIKDGLYLTGGSSNIRNLDAFINRELGFRVNITEDPSDTVVKGLGRIMKEKSLERLAYSLNELKEQYS